MVHHGYLRLIKEVDLLYYVATISKTYRRYYTNDEVGLKNINKVKNPQEHNFIAE